MAFLTNKWIVISLVILCWALATSFTTVYYHYQYNDLFNRFQGTPIMIDLAINYDNGSTTQWFNGTKLKISMTLFEAMELVGWKINGTSYGTMGLYITSINNVEKSDSLSHYWTWWIWSGTYGWALGQVAADKYVVSDKEIIIWYYSYFNSTTFKETPPPI